MEDFHHIAGLKHPLAEPAAAFRLDGVNDFHAPTLPDLGRLVQVMGPFGKWELRPFTECLLRSLDCRCSFSPSGIWNLRPYRAIGRVEILERLPCGRPASADIHAFENTRHRLLLLVLLVLLLLDLHDLFLGRVLNEIIILVSHRLDRVGCKSLAPDRIGGELALRRLCNQRSNAARYRPGSLPLRSRLAFTWLRMMPLLLPLGKLTDESGNPVAYRPLSAGCG